MKVLVDILWGYHILFFILFMGVKLTIKSGFLQVKNFFKWFLQVFRSDKNKNSGITGFQALSTALAGSIGTGNIVGVGIAISVGGAGAIFWMWISALFGMMTVFSEIAISASLKKKGSPSGAFVYIEKIGKRKILAFIYGLGCVLSSLFMGNMAQSNSVSAALDNFGIEKYITGILIAVILFFLMKKGLKSIVKLTELLVPFMTLFFLIVSAVALFVNREKIPTALSEIMNSAFSIRGTSGGAMFLAMRTGISRGVFTNEAGLGLSSMAFSNVKDKTPKELGYYGIFQVFIDTIVMCTITGLCVLVCTDIRNEDYLVRLAFSDSLGYFGEFSINLCMALFGFATVMATGYYGKVGLEYISKGRLNFLFPYLFSIAGFIGCIVPLNTLFEMCDAFNGLLAIPNLIGLAVFSSLAVKIANSKSTKLNNS